jgi:HlyD family secretion protein
MTLKRRIPIVVGLLVAVAIGVTFWSRLNNEQSATALTLYGNVDIREVELAFRVPGRLLAMHFEEGDAVTAGEVIAEIDPQPYRDALAVAEARVQQAHANFEKLKSGNRPEEVAQARAVVRQAQAAFDNADSELNRQNGLLEIGASSERTRNAISTQRDEAAAKLATVQEALALAEAGFRVEDIAAAQADLAAATAQKALSETQLDDTKLLAPSNGILTTRILEPGSMLGIGRPVYALSLSDPIYVRAYVDESALGKLAPGVKVTITTDSSTKVYEGQIGFISPRAEFTPRSVETTALRTDLVYRLRIIVSNGDAGLRQGMPVTVVLPLDTTAE